MLDVPLPQVSAAFKHSIDLLDETLREGAERASISPTLESKCELGRQIAEAGVRSIVVGMFPDVPHNITLLKALLDQQRGGAIAKDVRFLVISHVGETMRQTLDILSQLDRPLDNVWVIAIFSTSDQQLLHLFPTILRKDPAVQWDDARWQSLDDVGRRRQSLEWLDGFLPQLCRYSGGGVMVGLLDAFRAEVSYLREAVATVVRHGIKQIRIVDTAGTCRPQQILNDIGPLVHAHPEVDFYGHFHDDFGMATGNALLALAQGMKGVDVAVGGFANRAGHPPLAEVALSLRMLYGVELEGFQYHKLYELSRSVERTYGLMESPTQAITGVVTHSILSGIRTELLRKAPTIFDVIDPTEVGSKLTKAFGARSGRDGMLRFLKGNIDKLEGLGIEPDAKTADELFTLLDQQWNERSSAVSVELLKTMQQYHTLLQRAFFTEDAMLEWITTVLAARQGKAQS